MSEIKTASPPVERETNLVSGEDVKESTVDEKASNNNQLEDNVHSSKTSTRDLAHHDEEKALPSSDQTGKDTTAVIDTEHDPNVVDWDGDDDPDNPYNWSKKKKWMNIGILSALTLLTPLGSSFFAPGVPRVMADFNSTSEITATFVVSVQVYWHPIATEETTDAVQIYPRLCVRPSLDRTTQRTLRTTVHLPRLQSWLPRLHYSLRSCYQHEHAHRLPLFCRLLGRCTRHDRWWHGC